MAVNPEMLILAREAEGYSVRAFAEEIGVNHSTLSRYESGLIPVPDAFVELVSQKLNRPVSYFHRSGKRYDASGNFHRKRANMSAKHLKKMHAKINEIRLQAAALLEWADVDTDSAFFRLDQRDFGGPEGVARELRRLWQLPSGPVNNVIDVIEGGGGVVFTCDFETTGIDGVSQWPLDDESMPPVFFINSKKPGDRFRFTLSHEIAHVVMHHLPSPDIEGDADRFAAEFLMPEADIIEELEDMTIEKAADLKSRWRTSMAALIRRARDLGVLSQSRYTNLMKRMSSLGYRKCEPVPLPCEEPALFDAILKVSRQDLGKSDHEMCEILSVTPSTLGHRFGYGQSGFRLRLG